MFLNSQVHIWNKCLRSADLMQTKGTYPTRCDVASLNMNNWPDNHGSGLEYCANRSFDDDFISSIDHFITWFRSERRYTLHYLQAYLYIPLICVRSCQIRTISQLWVCHKHTYDMPFNYEFVNFFCRLFYRHLQVILCVSSFNHQ
jgi:hypothetical protein